MNSTLTAPERRERFRQAVRQLDGSGKAGDALSQGLVLPRPDGVLERLVGSLEIREHGTHLLFGTIGSGKTTLLLQAQKLLIEAGIPVGYTDAGSLDEQMGFEEDPLLTRFTALFSGAPPKYRAVFVDGCDRRDADIFAETLATLLPEFTKAGVGLVIVGPPSLQAVPPSFEENWVDQHHVCGTIDLSVPSGKQFLDDVLTARAGDLFTEEARDHLRVTSGGVLRDLLLVARQAVENAYISGKDIVTAAEVRDAAYHLGRSLLRGVDRQEMETLRHFLVEPPGPGADLVVLQRFVLQRWLLASAGTPTVYTPHPCIAPFLDRVS